MNARGPLAFGVALLSGGVLAAAALLPVDEAFRFGARALDARTIEARITMPPGYYLYRDKLRFSTSPPLGLAPPVLPPGESKDDPFFGRVEVYRGEVRVPLRLADGAPGTSVVVEAESQGCAAEVGVCYPPNRQRVTVALPAAGAAPGDFVLANPPRKGWFK